MSYDHPEKTVCDEKSVTDQPDTATEAGVAAPGTKEEPSAPPTPPSIPTPSSREKFSQFIGKVGHVEKFHFEEKVNVDPSSQMAERFRSLRSSLQTLKTKKGVSSVMFTSCYHSEGKTVSAVNLARYLAKSVGKRVVLVDCDLRKPRVKHYLNLGAYQKGLDDVLLGKASLYEATTFSNKDNLAAIGTRRGHSNATELLDTPLMDQILDELKEAFDYVIVDSTPILSTSDPIVVGQKVDGALIAVRAGETQRESVEHSIEMLMEADIKVFGVVLTFMKYYIPRYLSRYQYDQDYHYHYADKSRNAKA